MKNNEELVLEDNTENVEEQTTEEIVDGKSETTETEIEPVEEKSEKKYSDEELDEIVKKKLYRKETKLRDEYEKKYGKLEQLLTKGLEKDTFEEAVDSLEDFYKEKGITIETPKLSNRETEILAKGKAEEIISSGYEDIVEETDRLFEKLNKGQATDEEKKIFEIVATERKRQEGIKELKSIGVKPEDLTDEFKDFAKKLNPEMSVKEQYEMFLQYKPKEKIEKIGSVKDSPTDKDEVKSFYTYEEASKFTKEDLDKNPKLVEAIEKSMSKW